MKKMLMRIFVALLALLAVALAVAFFSLNAIVKKTVETRGPQMTGVAVRLGAVDLSPFSGSGSLTQLFVGNPGGYQSPFAVQVGRLKVAVQLGSVFSDTIVVDEINIQDPEVALEGTLDGNNLSAILDHLTASSAAQEQQQNAPPPPGQARQKKFIVRDFTLHGAKLYLHLHGFEKPLNQTLPISDLHLRDIGASEGGVSAAELSRRMFQPVLASARKAARDALVQRGLEYLDKSGGSDVKKAAREVLTNLFK